MVPPHLVSLETRKYVGEELQPHSGLCWALRTSCLDARFPWSYGSPWWLQSKN